VRSAGGTATVLASLQTQPTGIAVQGATIYWTNYDGDFVMSAAFEGGAATTLATGQGQPSEHPFTWVYAGEGRSDSGGLS
jgi:hypothetical protein